ncbi:MAG: transketolase [Myxococcales bacterium]|nr:transketolase [Myxococcales bacterium]
MDANVVLNTANTIKVLTMDAVEAATCGHPGMPMGMSTAAAVLWGEVLKFDPAAPNWPDRDRFVLSAGHGSMLLYSLLHLAGSTELTMDELKRFRQWGARTAGHPEFGEAGGIETTTGPLGQGFANAVGMALAERLMAGRVNDGDTTLIDHFTYAIAGDGCLMEGVANEAASLAGHLGLGKLVVLYDDNGITIDGTTAIAFTEDVPARFRALGWRTETVDGHDAGAVFGALQRARAAGAAGGQEPTLISCKTHIGHGSPAKQDTSDAHGSRLGSAEVAATKRAIGMPESETFTVHPDARAYLEAAAARGAAARRDWESRVMAAPEGVRNALSRQLDTEIPAALFEALPRTAVGKGVATRKASGQVLNALADKLPQLLGGSADLAGSNNTDLDAYEDVARGAFGARARNLRYGVREHAMAAVMNGLSLHGGFRPYGGTFLVFSDYMRGAMRLSAIMHQPVVYVLTHDSVFLGEDGPTHQPVEHAMSLRLIPNLWVVRPADANETIAAWQLALERKTGPTALLLTRQNVPAVDASNDGVLRGGYVLRREEGAAPTVTLIATGSEVALAMATADLLGPGTRVVSLPCWEAFAAQTPDYRKSVIGRGPRVAIEAGRSLGWERWVGEDGLVVGIDRFGASAPAERLASEFGFTPAQVAARVRGWLG